MISAIALTWSPRLSLYKHIPKFSWSEIGSSAVPGLDDVLFELKENYKFLLTFGKMIWNVRRCKSVEIILNFAQIISLNFCFLYKLIKAEHIVRNNFCFYFCLITMCFINRHRWLLLSRSCIIFISKKYENWR